MAIHQLAVFWRDEQARYFTAWHFQPASQERASNRAHKILSAVSQLSILQIYGAALDTAPLRLEEVKPAPAHGTETRLEVSLMPAAKAKVGGGQMRFTIPGPTEELDSVVREKQFSASEWQLLEKEVIPYICSPEGIKVSVSPDHLIRAEIAHLDSEHRPQPGEAPLDSALARTQEAVEAAKLSHYRLQTPKTYQRIEKYQLRLEQLKKWQDLEQQAFSQISQLETIEPAPTTSAPAVPKRASALTVLTTIKSFLPQMEQLKPSLHKEAIMIQSNQISSSSSFLPAPPSSEEADLWKDVPIEHFSLTDMWTHRIPLRESYGLNERTYYRWINELKAFGLQRSLPAQGNARVTLFYRPDFEHALQLAETASRARKRKAATYREAEPSSTTVAQAPQQLGFIASQLANLSNTLAALATQQKALSQAIVHLESNLAEQRQADLSEINQQLHSLALKQTEMAAQLPQAHLVDLISQLVSLNQLPKALQKLSTNVRKLAEPKVKKEKTTKTKRKKRMGKAG